MLVILSARGVTLTPAIKSLVVRKLAKLERVLPRIIDAKVVCSGEKFRRNVSLTLRARRRIFVTRATAPDLTAAVEAAVVAARHQVQEAKDRRRSRKGGSPAVARPA
ncbi:MAG: ribosome-associated translation inhibitor RaiA [Candidatus Rokubacteria bacterium]|nr:ribosome-associated translation inhibitor RaiA [Candidatus Rokubacteria bacterium]